MVNPHPRSVHGAVCDRPFARALEDPGFTLLEVVVSTVLAGLIAVSIAPMVLLAMQTTSVAEEITELTALAYDELEVLTALPFEDTGLAAGGALDRSVADYSIDPIPGADDYYLRWRVTDESPIMKRISIVVGSYDDDGTSRREVLVETFRTSMQ